MAVRRAPAPVDIGKLLKTGLARAAAREDFVGSAAQKKLTQAIADGNPAALMRALSSFTTPEIGGNAVKDFDQASFATAGRILLSAKAGPAEREVTRRIGYEAGRLAPTMAKLKAGKAEPADTLEFRKVLQRIIEDDLSLQKNGGLPLFSKDERAALVSAHDSGFPKAQQELKDLVTDILKGKQEGRALDTYPWNVEHAYLNFPKAVGDMLTSLRSNAARYKKDPSMVPARWIAETKVVIPKLEKLLAASKRGDQAKVLATIRDLIPGTQPGVGNGWSKVSDMGHLLEALLWKPE